MRRYCKDILPLAVTHKSVYNIHMKSKSKKIRKNIMIKPDLLKEAKNILNADSDSQAIEMALTELTQQRSDDDLWKATAELVNHMKEHKIKPLFS